MERKERTLAIFYRGLKGEKLNTARLAEEYGVSVKSISRCMTEIRGFLAENRELLGHAELQYSRNDKCYILQTDEFLTDKELLAVVKILIGSRAFSKTELLSIITKMKQFVSAKDRGLLESLIAKEKYHYCEVKSDCDSVVDNLWKLAGCIRERQEITVTYNKMSRERVTHLSFISDVMTFAVKLGMIPDNPCSAVIVPKGKKKEKEIYTIDEVKRLFELSENAPMKYRTFLSLSVYSGFRRAEMLGLEWKDVDFENNIISIRRTSNYTTAYGYFTDTTKTKTSQRSMKFPAHIMELLKDWKAEQAKQAELMGNKWVNTDRLFTKDNGEPMFTGMPYKWLERLCTANNLPFYGIHSLRHINNMKTSLLKIRLKTHISPQMKAAAPKVSLFSLF